MNVIKNMLRAAAVAAVLLPVAATAPAASADTASGVKVTIDSIVPWHLQESDYDEIYVRVVGPGLLPLTTRTVHAWPTGPDNPVRPVKANTCYAPGALVCPPGMDVDPFSNPGAKPTFPARDNVNITIREDDFGADDVIFSWNIPLAPLTTSVRKSTRIVWPDGSDYQLTVTLSPSDEPV
ncbi:hypothetical protein [Microbispora triticiradicis]|uniref:hypothetical protein n=1 Tax=Microbispora triticiradicis TaxID=2200763 RepID=UPI001AD6A701|nr:hypothetical protein [Microbispora triticiradicis]MBO4271199.1 hypothetical protein [Microbispora triticiradicis]